MDGTTISAITTLGTVAAGAIGAVYNRLNKKLDRCEEKHEQCEERSRQLAAELRTVDGRLQRIEGFLDGQEAEET